MNKKRTCPGCGTKLGKRKLFCLSCWRRAPLMLRLAYSRADTLAAQRLAHRGLLNWFKRDRADGYVVLDDFVEARQSGE